MREWGRGRRRKGCRLRGETEQGGRGERRNESESRCSGCDFRARSGRSRRNLEERRRARREWLELSGGDEVGDYNS